MNKYLLLFITCFSLSSYGQSLTPTRIIFETNTDIVFQNGQEYTIVQSKNAQEVKDPTIFESLHILGYDLALNRVLWLTDSKKTFQLIEWQTDGKFYYQRRSSKPVVRTTQSTIGE